MGKKFNELAWKNAELGKQVEKERRTRELLFDIAGINAEAIEAIMKSAHGLAEGESGRKC